MHVQFWWLPSIIKKFVCLPYKKKYGLVREYMRKSREKISKEKISGPLAQNKITSRAI